VRESDSRQEVELKNRLNTQQREQLARLRQAVDRKVRDVWARRERVQRSLIAPDRPPDELSPRAKSTGHKKKTADKWNQ
jgi:hypothetical protein